MATTDICGDTAEECLMRTRRGPTMEHRLGQMVYHYPFLLITGSTCLDWLPSPRLAGRASPSYSGSRTSPAFSSTCVSSRLPLRPDVSGSEWSPGYEAGRGEAGMQLPPAREEAAEGPVQGQPAVWGVQPGAGGPLGT